MLVGIADISLGNHAGQGILGQFTGSAAGQKCSGCMLPRYHCITSIGRKHGSTRIVRFVGTFTPAMPWVAIAGNASGHIAVSAVSILIWLA